MGLIRAKSTAREAQYSMGNGQLTMHAVTCSLLILLMISAAVKTASIASACTSPVSVGVVVMSTRCGFN